MNLPTPVTKSPNPPERRPVGRLAPSPTGGLHVGHARTFLIAWLASRSRGGKIILRIEDLDPSRTRLEAKQGMQADLAWLGLDWDEGPDLGGPSHPYDQSERMEHYAQSLERLKALEFVYPCTCTRADILRAASAPHAEDEGLVYPGTCAHRRAADAESLADRPFAWRFRVPARKVVWIDQARGPLVVAPDRLGGDFVVARAPAGVSYQLAVVTDDALMGINQVIRGDDLIPSTPRQILLYEALGWPAPEFGHVPLTLDQVGRRLAKRDGAIKLATLREQGFDPRQLVGILAQSCGWSSHIQNSRPHDWLEAFRWENLPLESWILPPLELA